MERSRSATVLMSGGIDSAACAAFLIERGLRVTGLFIDYGQAAVVQERACARSLGNALGIEVRELMFKGAAQFSAGELVGRNAFFAFAALFSTRGQSSLIALGVHAGTPYYDCSLAFVDLMNRAVSEHTDKAVQIIAPFVDWTKRDVYDYFVNAGLAIEHTYSCEAGGEQTCEICASCVDRKALQC